MFENIVYRSYGWYLQTDNIMYEGIFYSHTDPFFILSSVHVFVNYCAASRHKELACYCETMPYTDITREEIKLPSRKEIAIYKLKNNAKYSPGSYTFNYVYELVEEIFCYDHDIFDTLAFGEFNV